MDALSPVELGTLLRALRRRMRMTQREAATRSLVGRITIVRIENGYVLATRDVVTKLLTVYGASSAETKRALRGR